MSEWWTYRPSDFLMFSARTYYRLFELYNAEVWPAHLLATGLGLALGLLALRSGAWAAHTACGVLAAGWLWVAWAYHLQRYAAINSAATWFAAAFAIEALLLFGAGAAFGARWRLRAWRRGCGSVGLGLLGFGLLVQPWVGVALGRSWRQAEVFGLAPDPTSVATLGVLLLLRPSATAGARSTGGAPAWLLWPIPLLWCGVSGATLWVMGSPGAWLMPGAALLALGAAWRDTGPGDREPASDR